MRAVVVMAWLGLSAACAPGDEPVEALGGSSTGSSPMGSVPPGSASATATDGSTGSPEIPDPSSGPEPSDSGTPADPSTTGSDDSSTGEPGDPGPPFELTDLDAPHSVVLGVRGPGQAWADYDGDGWLDLLTVGGMAPSLLWHNEGDGTFAPSPLADDFAAITSTVGATFADYDNDGDPDLYLLRHGANVLLRNDGGLAFVDVSDPAAVALDSSSSSAAWADYDGDGWLDLYVATVSNLPDALFHNEGNGTFTSASHLLPGWGLHQAYGVTFSDFDGDGDVDLYVANDKKVGNLMWRNDGPGCGGWCFSNVSAIWGANIKVDSMGVAVGDYDNDLDLDLSVTDNHRHNIVRNLAELGTPSFLDVSSDVGVIFDAYGWGTIFFDYDNDGWLDLYVADARLGAGFSSKLFHNQLGTFVDATAGCGCAEPGWTHGVTYADYDHDGAVDLVVGNRGTRHELYRNRNTSGHRWLAVELHGAGSINRDAVGARVWVTTTGARVLMQEIKLGSSVASQNSLRLHFGLGTEEVDAVQIRWPNGVVEEPAPPATDSLWVYTYPG